MTLIMTSDKLVATRKEKLRLEIKSLLEGHYIPNAPQLAAVLSGDDPQSAIYVEQKQKACAEVGIRSIVQDLREDLVQHLDENTAELNRDEDVNGIILQLPLRKGVNERQAISHISPSKDVDGLTETNAGKLFYGNADLVPCTPAGIMDLFKHYNVQLKGSHVVIINRSRLIGKPLSHLFLNEDATVTICHSKTKGLAQITRQADINVVGVGRPGFKFTPDMVKSESVLVLLGGYRNTAGKMVWDADGVNYKDAGPFTDRCAALVPPTHGAGPMTVLKLMENTLTATLNQHSVTLSQLESVGIVKPQS